MNSHQRCSIEICNCFISLIFLLFKVGILPKEEEKEMVDVEQHVEEAIKSLKKRIAGNFY
jgi:hypothetical protein